MAVVMPAYELHAQTGNDAADLRADLADDATVTLYPDGTTVAHSSGVAIPLKDNGPLDYALAVLYLLEKHLGTEREVLTGLLSAQERRHVPAEGPVEQFVHDRWRFRFARGGCRGAPDPLRTGGNEGDHNDDRRDEWVIDERWYAAAVRTVGAADASERGTERGEVVEATFRAWSLLWSGGEEVRQRAIRWCNDHELYPASGPVDPTAPDADIDDLWSMYDAAAARRGVELRYGGDALNIDLAAPSSLTAARAPILEPGRRAPDRPPQHRTDTSATNHVPPDPPG